MARVVTHQSAPGEASGAGPTASLFLCKHCGVQKPKQDFHASCVMRHIHRCKACTQIKNRNYFLSAKDTTVKAWRIRRRVCRGHKPLSRIQLADVFELHGRQCFITQLTGLPLALIQADPDLPFSAKNAVPVLARLSSALGNLQGDALKRWRESAKSVDEHMAAEEPRET